MNPDDYVSYPIALALKKAGFDEPCDHYYCTFDNETDVRFWSIHPAQSQNGLRTPQDTVVADAPTLAQAQKWLRDMKRLSIEPYANIAVAWNYNIADLDNFAENVGGEASFPSYESALSAGIAAALELVEKKGE